MNTRKLILWSFGITYLAVSLVSTIHIISFYNITNPNDWMPIALAVTVELGAISSFIAAIASTALKKNTILTIFVMLTAIQIIGNMYYAYIHIDQVGVDKWAELFWMGDTETIFKNRLASFIQGGLLPIIGVLFVKSIADYNESMEEQKESDAQTARWKERTRLKKEQDEKELEEARILANWVDPEKEVMTVEKAEALAEKIIPLTDGEKQIIEDDSHKGEEPNQGNTVKRVEPKRDPDFRL